MREMPIFLSARARARRIREFSILFWARRRDIPTRRATPIRSSALMPDSSILVAQTILFSATERDRLTRQATSIPFLDFSQDLATRRACTTPYLAHKRATRTRQATATPMSEQVRVRQTNQATITHSLGLTSDAITPPAIIHSSAHKPGEERPPAILMPSLGRTQDSKIQR